MRPISRETIVDRRQPQMYWSAVLGGAVLAIGLWIFLQVLGMGIGLAAVDTDDAGSLRGVGIGTGIGSLIAPLVAMFVGGLLVGQLSGSRERRVGAINASVMWALATVVGVWAMISVISSVASGAIKVGNAAVSATSSVVGSAVSAGGRADTDAAMSALGIDTNDLLAPVNQRLQKSGKPPVTARELNATVRAVVQRGLHDGRIDREVLVDELARNTALDRADAQDLANQFGDRYQELVTKLNSAGDRVAKAGLEAADNTGKILLLCSLMMLLSLGAAVGGGALGVRVRSRAEDIPRDEPILGPTT